MRATFGPWIGVPKNRQGLCAVVDCIAPGKPHACPFDGSAHHHGCVHYKGVPEATAAGLQFREGWGWLCDEHYLALMRAKTP